MLIDRFEIENKRTRWWERIDEVSWVELNRLELSRRKLKEKNFSEEWMKGVGAEREEEEYRTQQHRIQCKEVLWLTDWKLFPYLLRFLHPSTSSFPPNKHHFIFFILSLSLLIIFINRFRFWTICYCVILLRCVLLLRHSSVPIIKKLFRLSRLKSRDWMNADQSARRAEQLWKINK